MPLGLTLTCRVVSNLRANDGSEELHPTELLRDQPKPIRFVKRRSVRLTSGHRARSEFSRMTACSTGPTVLLQIRDHFVTEGVEC